MDVRTDIRTDPVPATAATRGLLLSCPLRLTGRDASLRVRPRWIDIRPSGRGRQIHGPIPTTYSKIYPPASAKFSENRGHFSLASGHRNPLSRSFVPLASRLQHRASPEYRFVTLVRRSNRSKGNDGRAQGAHFCWIRIVGEIRCR